MKLLVCVKHVIDIEQQIDIRNDRLWIAENEDTRFHMNYFDEFAVEEAVRIKERFTGVTIDVLTLGPGSAEVTLRRAMALGADHAIHILSPENGFVPAEETAFHIAEFVKTEAYDLILFGVMSEDSMQSLTGPMTAAMCGLPCAAAVVDLTMAPETRSLTAVCELAGGLRETVRLPLPAVITTQSGINQPRYASLSNRLRAKSQAIRTIVPESTKLPKPRQHPLSVFLPAKTGAGEFIQGTIEEKARTLIDLLHQKSLI
ncbi:MAG: electron transfer flavoprotein subunit beta/FixA family protein [Thermodesulfobacteriota bacterium]